MAEDAHILVVDDDARLRDAAVALPAGEGFRVTTAETPPRRAPSCAAINPDLMVLDVMMPGESGLDADRSLRREHGTTCRCCC